MFNETEIFSVPISSGSSYDWSVNGGTIDAGNGTASIAVTCNALGTAQLMVVETDTNGCIGDTVFYNFVVYEDVSADVNFLKANELVVFPHPVTDVSILQFDNAEHKYFDLIVFDLFGNKVFCNEGVYGDRMELNKSDFSNGYYLLELRSGSCIYRTPIIVH